MGLKDTHCVPKRNGADDVCTERGWLVCIWDKKAKDQPIREHQERKMAKMMMGILVVLTISFVISGYYILSQNVVRMKPHATGDFAYPKFISRVSDGDVDDVSEARRLEKKVRVLVWVMTSPQNLQKRARAVHDTWGKRCNKLLFFSSETDKNFPTIGLNVSEGRDHLTAKTMNGFRYVYEHHLDDADWFMKVDDDTYVIVENLRYFLSNEDTREPVWFGHHFKSIVKQGYYSGGGGYVLSKEALKRLYQKGADPRICQQDGGAEDVEMARCLETLGVRTSNTSDLMGRSRFHCFDPETFLFGKYPDWYYQYDTNGARTGIDVMSDYSITFHYVSPEKMQALEFYVYHLNPFGINNGRQNLNRAPFRSQSVAN